MTSNTSLEHTLGAGVERIHGEVHLLPVHHQRRREADCRLSRTLTTILFLNSGHGSVASRSREISTPITRLQAKVPGARRIRRD